MNEIRLPDQGQSASPSAGAKAGGPGTAAPDRGPRNRALDGSVCLLLRGVLGVFRILPGPLARLLGRNLGRLVWACSGRYRRQVLRHMQIALGDSVPEAERRRLCRRNFEHLGLFVAEFSRLGKLTKDNLAQLVDCSELKVLDQLLARQKGKGLLCVPAHHGNWELGGYAMGLQGYPIHSVARPLDNPPLNQLVDGIRERSSNRIIHKWQVLWKLKKLLDHGGIVTMSVDQNGGVAGLFAPLFGVAASTVTSPAELHLATGAPIVVVTLNRQPCGVRHVFRVWGVIEHRPTPDHAADLRAVIMQIHAAYEQAIRSYPEQWLWVHRRWKTRPPGEQPCPDGLPPKSA